MYRLAKIIVITIVVFAVAWVIKELIGGSKESDPEKLIEKFRLNGI